MSDRSYKLKARPNLFDLAIMDGYLCGGGDASSVQREAYWGNPPADQMPYWEKPEENRQNEPLSNDILDDTDENR